MRERPNFANVNVRILNSKLLCPIARCVQMLTGVTKRAAEPGGSRELLLKTVLKQCNHPAQGSTSAAGPGVPCDDLLVLAAGGQQCGDLATARQRQCLSREGIVETQGKGGVLATEAVETCKENAVS